MGALGGSAPVWHGCCARASGQFSVHRGGSSLQLIGRELRGAKLSAWQSHFPCAGLLTLHVQDAWESSGAGMRCRLLYCAPRGAARTGPLPTPSPLTALAVSYPGTELAFTGPFLAFCSHQPKQLPVGSATAIRWGFGKRCTTAPSSCSPLGARNLVCGLFRSRTRPWN